MEIFDMGNLSGSTIFVILGFLAKFSGVNMKLGQFDLANLLIIIGLAGWAIFFIPAAIRNISGLF